MMRVLTVARTSNYPPNHLNPAILSLPILLSHRVQKWVQVLALKLSSTICFKLFFYSLKETYISCIKTKKDIYRYQIAEGHVWLTAISGKVLEIKRRTLVWPFFFTGKYIRTAGGVITEVLQVPKDTNYHTHLISHYVGLMEQHVWTT